MSPKLLIGLLVVLVVFVAVNALLTAGQSKQPKFKVVQGVNDQPGFIGASGAGPALQQGANAAAGKATSI